ncbi:hypothetical protein COV89_04445 [Candidatus Shapirobacteria bacterium CG11_big_fil_rev_8_21_14_0_20_40_12]|uniref:PEGA domain-containing protein n=2 Tax=Candidatus Shapironibacteriota TaxID=1752721 RepID=A0A2M8GFU0_9BACT|nr:MAG: hypothetical protein COV89_04445 [Candidatus Shapirobacteria bacterium CG11_big_fil_rev_8_21_14_0_20_40_12]PJC76154.1 MAG: hypothetical protein CO010_03485 [Candidatus Shapirobacteria bacterium CG_4_8_14_3_um_filter_39_11]
MINFSKYRLHFFFLVIILLLSATFVVIKYARGYRIDFIKKTFIPNGILSANSSPVGANVLINGKLKTATNNTLSLSPQEYSIEIKKTGFITWTKKMQIEKELVTFAEAFLFPEVPDLKPLTFNGALNPKISPDNTHIVYSIPLPFPEAGLWVIDLTDSLFAFSKDPRLIAKSASYLDLAKTDYTWSPNSQQILLELPDGTKYLLDPNQLNSLALLEDVTNSLKETEIKWQREVNLNNSVKNKKVPENLQALLQKSTKEVTFSTDNTKIMYIATASAEIPENLIPPILSVSTQKQNRHLEPNQLYVYDIKEDRNFQISSAKSADQIPMWFPTSRHLVWINEDKKVVACEYDGTNLATIYSGSFINPFVFVSPSSSKLVILAEIDLSIGDSLSPTPTLKALKKTPSPTPTPQRPKTNLFSVSFR